MAEYAAALMHHYHALHARAGRDVGSQDAQDIAQEAFLRAWNCPNRPLAAHMEFGWIWGFAKNILLERARILSALRHAEVAGLQDALPTRDQVPVEILDELAQEEKETIDDCLGCLTAAERQVVVGRYIEDRTVAIMANELRRTPKATQSLLERALAKMRHRAWHRRVRPLYEP